MPAPAANFDGEDLPDIGPRKAVRGPRTGHTSLRHEYDEFVKQQAPAADTKSSNYAFRGSRSTTRSTLLSNVPLRHLKPSEDSSSTLLQKRSFPHTLLACLWLLLNSLALFFSLNKFFTNLKKRQAVGFCCMLISVAHCGLYPLGWLYSDVLRALRIGPRVLGGLSFFKTVVVILVIVGNYVDVTLVSQSGGYVLGDLTKNLLLQGNITEATV